jgi:hypothetical protein
VGCVAENGHDVFGMEGKCGFCVLWLLKDVTTNEIRTEKEVNVLAVKLKITE